MTSLVSVLHFFKIFFFVEPTTTWFVCGCSHKFRTDSHCRWGGVAFWMVCTSRSKLRQNKKTTLRSSATQRCCKCTKSVRHTLATACGAATVGLGRCSGNKRFFAVKQNTFWRRTPVADNDARSGTNGTTTSTTINANSQKKKKRDFVVFVWMALPCWLDQPSVCRWGIPTTSGLLRAKTKWENVKTKTKQCGVVSVSGRVLFGGQSVVRCHFFFFFRCQIHKPSAATYNTQTVRRTARVSIL